MKKLLVIMSIVALSSCGGGASTEANTDSIKVDTVTVSVDSVSVDTVSTVN